jgi:hypothetical protein
MCLIVLAVNHYFFRFSELRSCPFFGLLQAKKKGNKWIELRVSKSSQDCILDRWKSERELASIGSRSDPVVTPPHGPVVASITYPANQDTSNSDIISEKSHFGVNRSVDGVETDEVSRGSATRRFWRS